MWILKGMLKGISNFLMVLFAMNLFFALTVLVFSL